MDRTYKIPSHILDDLCSRFILNVPDDYRDDMIRTFFHIELAHWFYIDFHVPENPGLKIVGIKEFANQVFKHCPFLVSSSDSVDTLHQDWKAYKLSVPTYGIILLDPTMKYVLLVQGYSKSWGFPKGKVNEGEDPVKCAVRELFEETGFDAGDRVKENCYVEYTAGDQYSRLYIVPDVYTDTHFFPQTRNEIRDMQWFPLELLPMHKKDTSHVKELERGPNAFFMVIPFMKQLKRWISQKGGTYYQSQQQTTPKSQRKQKTTESQRAFAEQSLKGFEEILTMGAANPVVTAPGAVTDKPPGGRRGRKGGVGTRSPQYTLLQKDRNEENLKKVTKLKQNLNFDSKEPKLPQAAVNDDRPFKPCREWATFKLNIGECMKAANAASLRSS